MNQETCEIMSSFFKDYKKNPNVRLGTEQVNYFISSLENCYENPDAGYVKVIPEKANTNAWGTVLDGHTLSYINRPTSIRKVGEEYWVSNYYTNIAVFDDNFSYLGGPGDVYYGNHTLPNRIAYVHDFVLNQDLNSLYVVSRGYHVIKRFDKTTTGEWLEMWKSGTGSPGDVENDQFYSPSSIDMLPNGNLIVSIYNGKGANDANGNNGSVVEVDADTGDIIKTYIYYKESGNPWDNEIHNPSWVRVINGDVYISSFGKNLVGVWRYNGASDTLEYKTSFTKPSGIEYGSIYPIGLTVDVDNNLINIVCNGPKTIVGMGLDDHDIKYYVGDQEWDDRLNGKNNIAAFQDVRGCESYGSELVVCDYGNNRVQVVPKQPFVTVNCDFEIPVGYRNLFATNCVGTFDEANKTLTVSLNEAKKIEDFYIMLHPET